MGKKHKLEGRIYYDENWHNDGEHYVFELKWSDEGDDAWGLDSAFKLLDYEDRKGAVLSYTALTKVREWMACGVDFYFGK